MMFCQVSLASNMHIGIKEIKHKGNISAKHYLYKQ